MKIYISSFIAGLFLISISLTLHAQAPFMGESSTHYCERCKSGGAQCECSIGVPKVDWNCDCGERAKLGEKNDMETAAVSKESTTSRRAQPTTFMDALQRTVNMPSTTQMGMEVEGAPRAPSQ